jgi:hypothetical protein
VWTTRLPCLFLLLFASARSASTSLSLTMASSGELADMQRRCAAMRAGELASALYQRHLLT